MAWGEVSDGEDCYVYEGGEETRKEEEKTTKEGRKDGEDERTWGEGVDKTDNFRITVIGESGAKEE